MRTATVASLFFLAVVTLLQIAGASANFLRDDPSADQHKKCGGLRARDWQGECKNQWTLSSILQKAVKLGKVGRFFEDTAEVAKVVVQDASAAIDKVTDAISNMTLTTFASKGSARRDVRSSNNV